MRVHHLDCGRLRSLGGRLLGDSSGGLTRGNLTCHCVLIEHPKGLALIDTGLGTRAITHTREWLPRPWEVLAGPVPDPEYTAVAQIRALGYEPGDVRDVILTHLDLDHAGGLADFPEATVHLYAAELDALTQVTGFEANRYRKAQFAHHPRFLPHAETGEPWFGFDAVRALPGLPDSILLIPLIGHSRGHAGVAIDTGDRWLLAAGDSYYEASQLDWRRPRRSPGIAALETFGQSLPEERRRNQQRLRELVHEHSDRVTVFSAHSRSQLETLQAAQTPG
ncbi:MBL fold metallo-hydrolase [Nocardia sp. NPDC059240]|uniref:MBL fold metallo-hydrolase n=1 Tax=Nocardia sp. NPDC059240 TaxID=3346786 RepID=UPI0036BDA769